MKKYKLLVSAYAFSPELGSEYAQGWNYVNQLSNDFDITVLIGSSDGAMNEFSIIDEYLDQNKVNYEVIKVHPDSLSKFIIKNLVKKFGLNWFFTFCLNRWHKKAFKIASNLHQKNKYDLVHQLGPIGFINPGYMYKLNIPSYWGPICGYHYVNLNLALNSSKIFFLKTIIKSLIIFYMARSRRVSMAIRNFSELSFVTEINRSNFSKLYKLDNKQVICDQGLDQNTKLLEKSNKDFLISWCGSLDNRKNVPLLIDIGKELQKRKSSVKFLIMGDGHLKKLLLKAIKDSGLTNFNYVGHVSRKEVASIYKKSQISLFTTLSEAGSAAFLESYQYQCIPITFDIDGFKTNLNNNNGFKITTELPYKIIVNSFCDKIELIVNNSEIRAKIQQEIFNSASLYSWKSVMKKHKLILNKLLDNE